MIDEDIRLAAQLRVPVMVTAANRDQRELYARLVHASDNGGRGPFVTYSANGVSANLEASSSSPLARHGGDDGLLRRRFGQARGGTLFLDDVAMLTAELQARLFALVDEQLAPHSESTAPPAGHRVRIIAGASRHLYAERAAGLFCEPLFYRLNVIHIDLTNQTQAGGNPDENP